MNFSKSFYSIFDYCSEPSRHLFLGMGNPEAKILLIGKECAFPENGNAIDADVLKKREKESVDENLKSWGMILHPENYSQKETANGFNAMRPWAGQLNKVDRMVLDKETGESRNTGGTSATWVNYQKLNDLIFNDGQKSETIDFYENLFITELNQIPSAYSNGQIKELREKAIEKRKQMFSEEFFQRFPIIIVAAGHYPATYGFDMEKTFGVKWQPLVRGTKTQFYNLHYSSDSSKLLIHTRQLSMGVTNTLLTDIASHIRKINMN